MEDRPILMVLATDCPPEIEEEWSKWYSGKHVPDVLRFKGIRKAARYKIKDSSHLKGRVAGESSGESDSPKYLAIYEFENWQAVEAFDLSPEHEVTMGDWNRNWATKGAKVRWRMFCEPMQSWQK